MSWRRMLKISTQFPKELFCLYNGLAVRLHAIEGRHRPQRAFDLFGDIGIVKSKALNLPTYDCEN